MPTRMFALAACLAGLALLAWRVLGLGLADHWANDQPGQALAWYPGHPLALLRAAEQELAQMPTSPEVEAKARQALAANPLDGRPYRLLAQQADAAGDSTRALQLYRLAVQRAPRDLQTRAWLANYHAGRGEPAAALAHVDRMLRLEPEIWPLMRQGMLVAAKLPGVHSALLDVLASAPPWRATFLRELARDTDDLDAAGLLWQALRKPEYGLSPAELQPWLERLLREGRGGQAYVWWVGQLQPEALTELGNLFNGGFEREPSGFGFDWQFSRVPGARIERSVAEGAGGRLALRIAFDDRRVPFRHVRQVLALPAGDWLLTGRARADALRTERGLVWQVRCLPSGTNVGLSGPLLGHQPWRAFEFGFTVPDHDCAAQELLLQLPARIPAEQRIGGQAWFDDLAIRRALSGVASP